MFPSFNPCHLSTIPSPMIPFHSCLLLSLPYEQVMDLMCARLDITRRQIQQSVDENRCDWTAAMFNLLIDQPEGQGHLRDISRQQLASLMRTTSSQSQGSQGGVVTLPSASGTALTTSTPSHGAVATEATATPALQPTSINAVVRQCAFLLDLWACSC